MKTLDQLITFLRNHVHQLQYAWLLFSLLLSYHSDPTIFIMTLVGKLLLHLPLSPQQRKIAMALLFVTVLLVLLVRIAFADCVPADGHTCTLSIVG